MATVQRFRDSDSKAYSLTTNGSGHTLFTYDDRTDTTCRGNTADRVGEGNLLMALLSKFL